MASSASGIHRQVYSANRLQGIPARCQAWRSVLMELHWQAGVSDNTIRLWDAQTGEVSKKRSKDIRTRILSVVFGPNGKTLASGE